MNICWSQSKTKYSENVSEQFPFQFYHICCITKVYSYFDGKMKKITENEENDRKWRKNIKRFTVQNPLMKWPNLAGEYEQIQFVIEITVFDEKVNKCYFYRKFSKNFQKIVYFIEIMDRSKRLVTEWQRTLLEQLLRAISEIVSLARNADSLAS